jgi:hypothetical protein
LVLISDVSNSTKTKLLLGFKNQGKNPPKQETLVFLETTMQSAGESRKSKPKPGEIQGSRKPSVLVGFLRQ